MAQVNNNNDIKYLTPIAVDTKRKKYCRFKKNRIKYIDYKDAACPPPRPDAIRSRLFEII